MTEDLIKLSQAQVKAEAAKSLFEMEALQEAFARLEESYVSSWRNSAPHKTEDRETAYYRLQALEELKADIQSVASSGKITAFNMRSRLKS